LVRSPKPAFEGLRPLRNSNTQEIIRLNSGLFEYGSQRALWQITAVVRNCCVSIRVAVEPDFVTSSRLPLEFEAMDLHVT
jgi:hypothetical protein